MSQENKNPGLGKVIYSVDDDSKVDERRDKEALNTEVREADEESFPASDPPSFAGGHEPVPDEE